MRNERVKAFYKTQAWKKCRAAYTKATAGLCEICLQKGIYSPVYIVHHKIYLTPENVDDPSVTLDWNNLQAVCKPCHEEIHGYCGRKTEKRYSVDENGRVVCL